MDAQFDVSRGSVIGHVERDVIGEAGRLVNRLMLRLAKWVLLTMMCSLRFVLLIGGIAGLATLTRTGCFHAHGSVRPI